MKPKQNTAHVWVEVEGKLWRLSLDPHGRLTLHEKHKRRRVTLTAEDLVRKARQLREGSLLL